MEILELTLLLLAAVFISSVAEQVIPRFSLPLVQIGIGVVIAIIWPAMSTVQLDPELFLVLFIAPLLYDETRHADKIGLWRNLAPILSLAVGLVLVCVLIVGFVLHWIEPSVPLAAAFALGAALGPTDAVAVSALGKEVNLSARQRSWLSGEALINDASGVVSFQFAIAAALTGAFSAVEAGVSFLYTFFVGLLVGIVLGAAIRLLQSVLRDRGFESTTAHVVIEVLTPFVAFLAGESIGASGILSVVAAGLLINIAASGSPHRISPASARLNIVSSSVWEVLVFVINGVVFVMLGMQLPGAISPTWEDVSFSTPELLGLVLLITAIICVVRFIWLLVLELLRKPEVDQEALEQVAANPTLPIVGEEEVAKLTEDVPELDPFADPLLREALEVKVARGASARVHAKAYQVAQRNRSPKDMAFKALATTLAGPKGAVTLSIIFSLPLTISSAEGIVSAFPCRDMLIFLASGVILCTLLLANFLLPVLAPKAEEEDAREAFREAEVSILRNVIAELRQEKVPETAAATAIVVRRYRDRIKRIQANNADSACIRCLRKEIIEQQQQAVHDAILANEVSKEAGQEFADRLKHMQRRVLNHQSTKRAERSPWLHGLVASLPAPLQRLAGRWQVGAPKTEDKHGLKQQLLLTEQRAVDYLELRVTDPDPEVARAAAVLLMEHRTTLANLGARIATQGTTTLFSPEVGPILNVNRAAMEQREAGTARLREVQAHAFRLELEQIQTMREEGRLSRKVAHDLREEVYLMQMDQTDALGED